MATKKQSYPQFTQEDYDRMAYNVYEQNLPALNAVDNMRSSEEQLKTMFPQPSPYETGAAAYQQAKENFEEDYFLGKFNPFNPQGYGQQQVKSVSEQLLGVVSGTINIAGLVDPTKLVDSEGLLNRVADKIDEFNEEHFGSGKEWTMNDRLNPGSGYYTDPTGLNRDAVGLLGSMLGLGLVSKGLKYGGAAAKFIGKRGVKATANLLQKGGFDAGNIMGGGLLEGLKTPTDVLLKMSGKSRYELAKKIYEQPQWVRILINGSEGLTTKQLKALSPTKRAILEGISGMAPAEVMSEAGEVASDLRHQGKGWDEQVKGAIVNAMIEYPTLSLANRAEALAALKLFGADNAIKALSMMALESGSSYWEEATQRMAQDYAKDEVDSLLDVYNPFAYTEGANQEGFAGFVGMIPIGLTGAVKHRGRKTSPVEPTPQDVVQAPNASIPAGAEGSVFQNVEEAKSYLQDLQQNRAADERYNNIQSVLESNDEQAIISTAEALRRTEEANIQAAQAPVVQPTAEPVITQPAPQPTAQPVATQPTTEQANANENIEVPFAEDNTPKDVKRRYWLQERPDLQSKFTPDERTQINKINTDVNNYISQQVLSNKNPNGTMDVNAANNLFDNVANQVYDILDKAQNGEPLTREQAEGLLDKINRIEEQYSTKGAFPASTRRYLRRQISKSYENEVKDLGDELIAKFKKGELDWNSAQSALKNEIKGIRGILKDDAKQWQSDYIKRLQAANKQKKEDAEKQKAYDKALTAFKNTNKSLPERLVDLSKTNIPQKDSVSKVNDFIVQQIATAENGYTNPSGEHVNYPISAAKAAIQNHINGNGAMQNIAEDVKPFANVIAEEAYKRLDQIEKDRADAEALAKAEAEKAAKIQADIEARNKADEERRRQIEEARKAAEVEGQEEQEQQEQEQEEQGQKEQVQEESPQETAEAPVEATATQEETPAQADTVEAQPDEVAEEEKKPVNQEGFQSQYADDEYYQEFDFGEEETPSQEEVENKAKIEVAEIEDTAEKNVKKAQTVDDKIEEYFNNPSHNNIVKSLKQAKKYDAKELLRNAIGNNPVIVTVEREKSKPIFYLTYDGRTDLVEVTQAMYDALMDLDSKTNKMSIEEYLGKSKNVVDKAIAKMGNQAEINNRRKLLDKNPKMKAELTNIANMVKSGKADVRIVNSKGKYIVTLAKDDGTNEVSSYTSKEHAELVRDICEVPIEAAVNKKNGFPEDAFDTYAKEEDLFEGEIDFFKETVDVDGKEMTLAECAEAMALSDLRENDSALDLLCEKIDDALSERGDYDEVVETMEFYQDWLRKKYDALVEKAEETKSEKMENSTARDWVKAKVSRWVDEAQDKNLSQEQRWYKGDALETKTDEVFAYVQDYYKSEPERLNDMSDVNFAVEVYEKENSGKRKDSNSGLEKTAKELLRKTVQELNQGVGVNNIGGTQEFVVDVEMGRQFYEWLKENKERFVDDKAASKVFLQLKIIEREIGCSFAEAERLLEDYQKSLDAKVAEAESESNKLTESIPNYKFALAAVKKYGRQASEEFRQAVQSVKDSEELKNLNAAKADYEDAINTKDVKKVADTAYNAVKYYKELHKDDSKSSIESAPVVDDGNITYGDVAEGASLDDLVASFLNNGAQASLAEQKKETAPKKEKVNTELFGATAYAAPMAKQIVARMKLSGENAYNEWVKALKKAIIPQFVKKYNQAKEFFENQFSKIIKPVWEFVSKLPKGTELTVEKIRRAFILVDSAKNRGVSLDRAKTVAKQMKNKEGQPIAGTEGIVESLYNAYDYLPDEGGNTNVNDNNAARHTETSDRTGSTDQLGSGSETTDPGTQRRNVVSDRGEGPSIQTHSKGSKSDADGGTAVGGKQGDNEIVRLSASPEASTTRGTDSGRGTGTSGSGSQRSYTQGKKLSSQKTAGKQTNETSRNNSSNKKGTNEEGTPESRAQKSLIAKAGTADGLKIVRNNLQNIVKSLPLLLTEQIGDIVQIEQRWYQALKQAILCGNGTGTGKTFVGLGAVARAWMDGKRKILIVYPGGNVGREWLQASSKKFGLPALNVMNTSDEVSTAAPNIITNASMRDNPNLIKQNWDLIIVDECHHLAAGQDTHEYYNTNIDVQVIRALTGHRRGFDGYRRLKRKAEFDKIDDLNKQIKNVEAVIEHATALGDTNKVATLNKEKAKLISQKQNVIKVLDATEDGDRNEYKAYAQNAQQGKVLFLSATPFEYGNDVYWAEGYLFSYDDFGGYDRMMEDTLGLERKPQKHEKENLRKGIKAGTEKAITYIVPTEEVTTETGERVKTPVVNTEKEIAFHNKLRSLGAFITRALKVPYKYSRKFVFVQSREIDYVENGLAEMKKDHTLDWLVELFTKRLKGNKLRRFYEIIKARALCDDIEKLLEQGKHVVLVHKYKPVERDADGNIKTKNNKEENAPSLHPFKLTAQEYAALSKSSQAAYDAFCKSTLGKQLQQIPFTLDSSAEEIIKERFGNKALVVNGDTPMSKREGIIDKFNEDGAHLLVASIDVIGEGVSVHDTSPNGDQERVLINLAMLSKPSDIAQVEPRIFRYGQTSNARFYYVSTDSSAEQAVYEHKAGAKAESAENFARGDEARPFSWSFKLAYLRAQVAKLAGASRKISEDNESNLDYNQKYEDQGYNDETKEFVNLKEILDEEQRKLNAIKSGDKTVMEAVRRGQALIAEMRKEEDARQQAVEEAKKNEERKSVLTKENEDKLVKLLGKLCFAKKVEEVESGVYDYTLRNGMTLRLNLKYSSVQLLGMMTPETRAKLLKEANYREGQGVAGLSFGNTILLTDLANGEAASHELMHFVFNVILTPSQQKILRGWARYNLEHGIANPFTSGKTNSVNKVSFEGMKQEEIDRRCDEYIADGLPDLINMEEKLLNAKGLSGAIRRIAHDIYKWFANLRAQLGSEEMKRYLDALSVYDQVRSGEVFGQEEHESTSERANAMFAGENSATADKPALKQAKEMLKQGKDMKAIFLQTGWFQGKDGSWRYWIDDNVSKIDFNRIAKLKPNETVKLSDVYHNQELFKAYPELADVEITGMYLKDNTQGIADYYSSKLSVATTKTDGTTNPYYYTLDAQPVEFVLDSNTVETNIADGTICISDVYTQEVYAIVSIPKSKILLAERLFNLRMLDKEGLISWLEGALDKENFEIFTVEDNAKNRNLIINNVAKQIAKEIAPEIVVDKDTIVDAMIHEIQHFIQAMENWSKGGTPDYVEKTIKERIKFIDSALAWLRTGTLGDKLAHFQEQTSRLEYQMDIIENLLEDVSDRRDNLLQNPTTTVQTLSQVEQEIEDFEEMLTDARISYNKHYITVKELKNLLMSPRKKTEALKQEKNYLSSRLNKIKYAFGDNKLKQQFQAYEDLGGEKEASLAAYWAVRSITNEKLADPTTGAILFNEMNDWYKNAIFLGGSGRSLGAKIDARINIAEMNEIEKALNGTSQASLSDGTSQASLSDGTSQASLSDGTIGERSFDYEAYLRAPKYEESKGRRKNEPSEKEQQAQHMKNMEGKPLVFEEDLPKEDGKKKIGKEDEQKRREENRKAGDKLADKVKDGVRRAQRQKDNDPDSLWKTVQYAVADFVDMVTGESIKKAKQVGGDLDENKDRSKLQTDSIINYAYAFASNGWLAEKSEQFKAFFNLGVTASRRQEELRLEWLGEYEQALDNLKTAEDKTLLNKILYEGDSNGIEYTTEELKKQGASEDVIKAYKEIRKLSDKIWYAINEAHKDISPKFKKAVTGEALEKTIKEVEDDSFNKNVQVKLSTQKEYVPLEKFRKEKIDKDAKYDIKYERPRVYHEKREVLRSELEALKKDKNVQIASITTAPSLNSANDYVTVELNCIIPDIEKVNGYMPHLFEEWLVVAECQDKNGRKVKKTVGSGKTKVEAAKLLVTLKGMPEFKDVQLLVRPKIYDASVAFGEIGSDIIQNVSGDIIATGPQQRKMLQGLMKRYSLSLAEAEQIVHQYTRTSSAHRFLGSLINRTGAIGYNDDMLESFERYIKMTSRYIALEDFKYKAIPLYEKTYNTSFDLDAPSQKYPMSRLVKRYIKNINGTPNELERWMNNILASNQWVQNHIAATYGDRFLLSIGSKVNQFWAVTKLGGISSGIVNMTQLLNTYAFVGSESLGKGFEGAYLLMRKQPKEGDPDYERYLMYQKVVKDAGVATMMGMADVTGYSKNRAAVWQGKTDGFRRLLQYHNMMVKYGMWGFQKSDHISRVITAIAAYEKHMKEAMASQSQEDMSAKEQEFIRKKEHTKAIKYAEMVLRKAMFDYGVADTSLAMQAMTGTGIGEMALLFRKYPFKEFELMLHMSGQLGNKTSKEERMRFWVTYALLCGLGGFPLGDWLDGMFIESMTGHKLTTYLKAGVIKGMGDNLASRAICYGLPAVVGVDTSHRVGLADILPSNGLTGMMLGVTGSSLKGIYQGFSQDDYVKVVKSISPALGHALEALQGARYDSKGRLAYEYKGADRLLKTMGFRAVKEAVVSDLQSDYWAHSTIEKDDRKNIMYKYARKVANGKTLTREEKEELRKNGIKSATFMKAVKDMKKTTAQRTMDYISKGKKSDYDSLLN